MVVVLEADETRPCVVVTSAAEALRRQVVVPVGYVRLEIVQREGEGGGQNVDVGHGCGSSHSAAVAHITIVTGVVAHYSVP